LITFIICVLALIFGYIFYGKYIDRVFGSSADNITPAVKINDGVDYVVMKPWKLFLVQLLNIAGLGPIFGALNGALFGPIAYVWIVLGAIFAGAVHDYMSGMISMRHNGMSVAEISGEYLGDGVRKVMRLFSIFLLIMFGVVFSKGPAGLIALLTPEKYGETFWFVIIVAYYFIATFVPVDKVIGRIYPIFGICLIAMALGVGSVIMFSGKYQMPELWNNFTNVHPNNLSVWPFLFVTITCGAISGFHSTQSPMIARCCASEKQGHKAFYGAMIAESIIALVWAAAGVSFYENSQALLQAGGGVNTVVYEICTSTMGKIGGIIAMLGVIVCPITSGDTSYRSARLSVADWLKFDQKDWKKRLLLTVIILGIGVAISLLDYSVVWRYAQWINQFIAMIVLWTGAMYLVKNKKNHFICSVPATFITAMFFTYFVQSPECLGALIGNLLGSYLPIVSITFGLIITSVICILFAIKCKKQKEF